MITLFGAGDTVPRRGCPRLDKKNQLLNEGLLAYAYKVNFDPVIVLASLLHSSNICLITGLVEFLMLCTNLRYILFNCFLRPRPPDIGSTRYLCVSYGRLHIILMDLLKEPSKLLIPGLNKSQTSDPEK